MLEARVRPELQHVGEVRPARGAKESVKLVVDSSDGGSSSGGGSLALQYETPWPINRSRTAAAAAADGTAPEPARKSAPESARYPRTLRAKRAPWHAATPDGRDRLHNALQARPACELATGGEH